MMKLLHERLREHKDVHCGGGCSLSTISGVKCAEQSNCTDCIIASFDAIADEIERDYIPREQHEKEIDETIDAQRDLTGHLSAHYIMRNWAEHHDMPFEDGESITKWLDRWFIPRPRFEDGEPVQFGEKALRWDGKHGNDGENVVSITVEGGGYLRYGFNGDICSNQLFKRPQPKVYDADGVEIKVGDTVWHMYDGKRCRVISVEQERLEIAYDVYGIGEVSTSWIGADELTHKEPDSLEKLHDDIRAFTARGFYHGTIDMTLDEWSDRLSALIERGA